MGNPTIDNKTLNASTVVKLRHGQEIAAREAAKKNGADDVFFTLGRDSYVASGRGLNLKGVAAGTKIRYNGQEGTVTAVDNQVNSAKEGALKVVTPVAVAVGGATGGGAFVGGALGGLASAGAAGAAVGAVVVGAYALAAGAVAVGGGAAYGAFRKADSERLKAFGE